MFLALVPLLARALAAQEQDGAFEYEGELSIVATQPSTQRVETLTREDIEKAHAPDLAALLQSAAGLSITRYGPYGSQTDVNLRGFDSSRIAFLVNGVPVNAALDSGFDLNTIDLDSIERIEVIPGGADSRYNVSGALGGVINMVTMGKPKPGLRLSASAANTAALPGAYTERSGAGGSPRWEDLADGQKAQAALRWGTETDALSAGLFANRAANHFLFYDKDVNQVRRREHNEVYDAGARMSYLRSFADLSRCIVSGSVYYADKNIPTSFTSPLVGKQRDFSTRASAFFDMPRAWRDDLAMEASLSHGFQRLDYEAPSAGTAAARHDQQSLNAVNRWAWYASDALTLHLGGDVRYAALDSTALGRRARVDGGLSAGAEYTPAKSLLLSASLKGVFAAGGGAPGIAAAVPKAGLRWQPNAVFTLKANGYRGFKLPDFQDLYWNDGLMQGNPSLRPEDGWGAELSGTCRFGERAELEAAAFFQWTEDSIHWAPAAGSIWRPQNIARAALSGVDTKAALSLPPLAVFDKPRLQAAYRYLFTCLLSDGCTWADRKRIPYQPEHTVTVSLDLPWKSGDQTRAGSLTLQGRWESVRYADTGNNTPLASPLLLDVTVNQHIGERCAVFAAARNLLNQPYESFDDYYLPGLTITTGLRMEFLDKEND
ncbi:MAG: TonB-dependent receptor [Treponema sp.]|jgi:vitamin B12 transporter|nr:TonB-dependent receptor [Treponema sp.]